MTRLLVIAATLGFAVSAAGACERMRSVSAEIDQTTVASTTVQPMSTPDIAGTAKAETDAKAKVEVDGEG